MSRRDHLWADSMLRAAAASQDWPAVFRRYRCLSGLSQQALGELVGLTQGHVSTIERGLRQITSTEVVARIMQGLNVPTEVAHAVRDRSLSEWVPDPELRDRVARAQAAGRVDLRTAERLQLVLAEHRRTEDEVGGLVLWPVVRSQLEAITHLIPNTSGQAADTLLLLAAEHAHWLSWVAWQEGQGKIGTVLAWADTAHGWAIDGGHADMASWVLRMRSYYMLKGGDPVRALRTAEGARMAGGLSPAARAAATHQSAMAAAAVGDRDTARRLADEALRLARLAPDESDRPGWLYFLNETRAQLQAAATAYACRHWADAVGGFREALPALTGYPRDFARYAERLADAERRI
ncbi:helix-turn-helix domain-containing protein [Streptomyces sp. NPDC056549]|uniref:helix-turn-helix domain-containing protein n=1 Tax=Streptomyces sp. NPDC056549 TaxID=3345864 RepID=UPI0036BEF3A2